MSMFFLQIHLFVKSQIFYRCHSWGGEGEWPVFPCWCKSGGHWCTNQPHGPVSPRPGLPQPPPARTAPGRAEARLGRQVLLCQDKAGLCPSHHPTCAHPTFYRRYLTSQLFQQLGYLHLCAQRSIILFSLIKVNVSFFALSPCTACLVVTLKLL